MPGKAQSDPSEAVPATVDRNDAGEIVAALFRRHSGRVFAFLYRLLGDRGRSEDLTQECFLIVHRRLADSSLEDPPLFLFAVARNLAREERSRNSRRGHLFARWWSESFAARAAARPDNPHDNLAGNERVTLVKAAVSSLPDDLRVPLVLREYGELSYREIGTIMEIPVGTVRSRLYRARRALASSLLPLAESGKEIHRA